MIFGLRQILTSRVNPVDRFPRSQELTVSVSRHNLKSPACLRASFIVHGRRAQTVLAFGDGYGRGYIIGAIERRIGSLHALAPE